MVFSLIKVLTNIKFVLIFLSIIHRLGRYIHKLQSLFLYQFDPMRDYSLETIFYTLPKLSFIAEDEYLSAEWFFEIGQKVHLSFPISVHNVSTILRSCQPGIWRLTGKKSTTWISIYIHTYRFCWHYLAAGKCDISGTQDEEESSTIQHKANPYPVVEPLDDNELRRSIKRSQLVVVASLIDKQTNLGGKCAYEMNYR